MTKKVKVSDPTASAYLRILAAEGKVEIPRKVGNAVFYKEKRNPDKLLRRQLFKMVLWEG